MTSIKDLPQKIENADINEIINRGTVDVIVKEDLEKKLKSGKKLRIKFGIDPTSSNLHLGHMVPIKKLREFQKLGHHIILLFGNFTAQIGDPKAKEARKMLTQKEAEDNAQTYLKQVSSILDIKNIEVVWNANWLSPLSFADVIKLASNFTVSQMLERDLFQERIKKETPIYVHEFMYPLMQGYDSVALKADVEIGGTDQTFNLLAGRTLQKAYNQETQNVVTVPILEGLDGKIKMSKSENNYIGVIEAPEDQYGKVMSIPDHLILRYFELATEVPLEEIAKRKEKLIKGWNPRDAKMELAKEIVKIYHGENAAQKAQEQFVAIFQKHQVDEASIPEIEVKQNRPVIDLIMENKLAGSKNSARRLIDQGGVKFQDQKINDVNFQIKEKGILQVGKRRFLKINFPN